MVPSSPRYGLGRSWILQTLLGRRPGPLGVRERRWRLQPRLEALEDRVVPAFVITPTFDSTINSDPNAATIKASINRVIQSFEDSFSDNITVNITFKEVTTGLGGSNTANGTITYTSYLAALMSHATTADDTTALASLPAGPTTPVGGAGNKSVIVAAALQNALGLAGAVSPDGTISLNTSIMNLDRTLVLDNGNTTAGSNLISGLSKTASLGVGFPVVGAGIPGSTDSGNTMNGSNMVTGLSNTASLAVGEAVTGSGIPLGTTVAGIGPTSITLSNNATATATAVSLIFTTTIATIGPSSITLSNNATATATGVSLEFGQDPNKYDLMDTTAHEIDEVLAMGSAMDGQTNGNTANSVIKPLDLFRYSANGVRSYDTLLATTSYFSIDGGATNLVGFNQFSPNVPPGNTPDFGDWFSNNGNGNAVNAHVQDSNAQPGQFDTLSVELRRLDVLGYTRVTTAAPVVTPPADQTAVEGATTTLNLGSFSAASPNAPWGVTVSWGDGSTSPIFFVNSAGSLGTLSHTYAEEGSYTVTVNVTDFVTMSDSKTFKVNVSDPNVNAVGSFSFAAVEGALSAVQTVATFTDPGGPELPVDGHYTATISWGDSTPSSAGTITYIDGGSMTFTVTASHLYTEEGTYTISVTINHEGSTPQTVTSTATVSDPNVKAMGSFSFAAVEGALSAVQTVATFTDPGGPELPVDGHYTATISWGDSTPSSAGAITYIDGGSKTFTVTASHLYGEEGTYTITVTINHEGSTPQMVTSTATVTDPAVMAQGVDVSAKECIAFQAPVATFADPGGAEPNPSDNIDGIPSHYTATVDFGDGKGPSPAVITYSGAAGSKTELFTVTAMHAFDEEGTFSVTVTINHEGMITVAHSTATVRDNFGLLLLDPTGDKSLMVTGNGSATVNNCGAVVVDSSDPRAIFLTDNAVVSATEADVGLGGGAVTTGHAALNLSEPEFNHEAATPDPIALPLPPEPATHFAAVHYSSSVLLTLSPGTYDGGITVDGNGTVALLPGLYYMNGGGFSVTSHGSVTGTGGVLLVNAPAGPSDTISITGQASVVLTASTTLPDGLAAYDGIALMQDPASANPVSVTGQASLTVTGTVYAPSALLKIDGNGNAVVSAFSGGHISLGGVVVAFDTMVTGNGDLTINADPSPQFQLAAGSAIGLPSGSGLLGSRFALHTGPLLVAVTDSANAPSAAEQARIADAIASLNTALGPFGVNLVEASAGQSALATVRLNIVAATDFGGVAAGVLAVTEHGDAITLVSGWNWYLGADPGGIGPKQFDFETVVAHELAHAVGLGEGSDPSSVMYAYLGSGVTRRELSASDLGVIAYIEGKGLPEPVGANDGAGGPGLNGSAVSADSGGHGGIAQSERSAVGTVVTALEASVATSLASPGGATGATPPTVAIASGLDVAGRWVILVVNSPARPAVLLGTAASSPDDQVALPPRALPGTGDGAGGAGGNQAEPVRAAPTEPSPPPAALAPTFGASRLLQQAHDACFAATVEAPVVPAADSAAVGRGGFASLLVSAGLALALGGRWTAPGRQEEEELRRRPLLR
jgi:hypothetical protein